MWDFLRQKRKRFPGIVLPLPGQIWRNEIKSNNEINHVTKHAAKRASKVVWYYLPKAEPWNSFKIIGDPITSLKKCKLKVISRYFGCANEVGN